MKNFHFALMISQGVPMLLMGDEYGHTKSGNNNTWCQDNELNWFQWDLIDKNSGFFRFYKCMIALRKNHPIFRKGSFLTDRDIIWHGVNPLLPHFEHENAFLACTLIDHKSNEAFYVAFNASHEELLVTIPPPPEKNKGHKSFWRLAVDTAATSPNDFIDLEERVALHQTQVQMIAHSVIMLEAY